jgi:hypothetical protein
MGKGARVNEQTAESIDQNHKRKKQQAKIAPSFVGNSGLLLLVVELPTVIFLS